jgi:hypothetical protein
VANKNASDTPKRVNLTFEVPDYIAAQLRSLSAALNHDEPEETLTKLVELGVKAVSITTKENSKVTLYSRDQTKTTNTLVCCPKCSTEFHPNSRTHSDDYREVAVSLT